MENKILLNRKYRHYKGNVYEIIAFAKHSETMEDMIVYRSITSNDTWVRPYKMWNEIINTNGPYRFTLLD